MCTQSSDRLRDDLSEFSDKIGALSDLAFYGRVILTLLIIKNIDKNFLKNSRLCYLVIVGECCIINLYVSVGFCRSSTGGVAAEEAGN